jgi:DNA-binding PucR family transcriptional regulator
VAAEANGRECRVGVGGACEEPADFPRSHHEALLALRLQTAADASQRTTSYEDLGVYRVLADANDPQGLERFAREWLGALLDYDDTGRADLVATLAAYLQHGRSHEAAAATLSVHRSTLKYRLQRIGEVSGLDLADPDTAFNLQLAARAWTTLQVLRGDSPQR